MRLLKEYLRKIKNMMNEILFQVKDIQDINLIKHKKLKLYP